MGLLNKVKNLGVNIDFSDQGMPRYELFKSQFVSFLEKVGSEYGAFLIKHAAVFHLAFPVGIDAGTFKNVSFEAGILLDAISSSGNFLSFPNETNEDFSLLQDSFVYPMDENLCVFLLLRLDESSESLVSEEKKRELFYEVEIFKKKYKENESLINTCTPLYKRYVGFSFIESKLEGSALASMKVNFIRFSFDKVFDLLNLENDAELLPMFYSLVNRISILIGKSNFSVLQKDLSLNACVFSSQLLDKSIYNTTLKSVLSSVYGRSLIEKLETSFFYDIKNPKDEIKTWMENSLSLE